ncbi:MAG: caspase family protein [Bradyrhizobium sp.]|jgi:helicase|uniref:caspase family protein n=1 Tax=Bradyrhizobium sp. TaxID=376 RepID=UPI003C7D72AF
MTMKAVFVGIDRHRSPDVPELGGAKRDATALWALFSDSVPGLASRLLVDDQATLAAVRDAVVGTLNDAGADDIAVVSFAGHGSPDGSLVLYDTEPTDLAGSALSMTVLAEAFRTTKARVVLCILDCCFSGHAPARVIETSATPRSAFALTGIFGEGRILLAACAPAEAAWEQPGTGHGLLTYATIEAMSGSVGAPVSFPAVADEIIRLTRVEATRIGVTQTPAFLGNVQGGLVFPALVRGANYAAAFPPVPVHRITGSFAELAGVGMPQEIVDGWSGVFPDGLNALQIKAVNEFGMLAGKSLLTFAPTSSGKTLIGELAAIRAVSAGKKAVFLLPYRAW